MVRRRMYRQTRRSRKTRHRKPRWLNRKNSKRKNRFSPTMISKYHSHFKEIEYIKSILPIAKLIIEAGQFDTHLMKNPSLANPKIKSWGYQKGPNYGFENTRAMILNRDNYTCQYCKGKHKDSKLEVHHIVYRSNGGSNEESNLITLCHTCHQNVHNGIIDLKLKGKIKGTLKYTTQMNSIRIQLLRKYPEAIETFGYITKANRLTLGVDKEHYYDACVIATGGKPFNIKCNLIKKRCVADGDFRQTRGSRSEQKMPTGKIMGFRKFDKVKYLGKEYFIRGRRTRGEAELMDIEGNKINFSFTPRGKKIPKMKNMVKITARTTQLIMTINII